MELLQTFIDKFLTPLGGDPHVGLFLFVWFSAVFPLAPPEEAFTLLGGACIATGVLKPFYGGLAIIGGIIATDLTQYWMGRGGLKLLSETKLGKRLVNSRSFARARSSFEKKGIWAIIGCRFFFGTRAPTYMATGFLHYSFIKFAIVDSSVVLLHGLTFLIIGYVFHRQIDGIVGFFEKLGIWSLVVLIGLIALFVAYKLLKNRHGAQYADVPRGGD